MDLEPIAKAAVDVAAGIVGGFSPLGGLVLKWAGKTAFEVYDLEKANENPIAIAQHCGDRVADLVETIKLGSS